MYLNYSRYDSLRYPIKGIRSPTFKYPLKDMHCTALYCNRVPLWGHNDPVSQFLSFSVSESQLYQTLQGVIRDSVKYLNNGIRSLTLRYILKSHALHALYSHRVPLGKQLGHNDPVPELSQLQQALQ